jgi:hypothetical protein
MMVLALIQYAWLALLAAVPPAAPVGSCGWPEATGEHLLERHVGTLSLRHVDFETALAKICDASDVPLSSVQLDDLGMINLELKEANVRDALDALMQQVPTYRYDLIGGRLVVYPRDPLWGRKITDISLGPARRLEINRALVKELARRVPELANLAGPWVMGDTGSYNYNDIVSVHGPASILDLILQLLGNRPSVFIILDRRPGSHPSLSVATQDQIVSLSARAPTTVLHGRTETAQLDVTATLWTGAVKKLASSACATVYSVADDKVLTVSADGLVAAKGNGTTMVTITNEHSSAFVTFTVSLSNSEVPRP